VTARASALLDQLWWAKELKQQLTSKSSVSVSLASLATTKTTQVQLAAQNVRLVSTRKILETENVKSVPSFTSAKWWTISLKVVQAANLQFQGRRNVPPAATLFDHRQT